MSGGHPAADAERRGAAMWVGKVGWGGEPHRWQLGHVGALPAVRWCLVSAARKARGSGALGGHSGAAAAVLHHLWQYRKHSIVGAWWQYGKQQP